MNSVLASFFKNKRILITGNTGFKGSWLSLVLYNYGANIYGYSKNTPQNNDFSFLVHKHCKTVQQYGDVTDKNILEQTINNIKPDLIFHLAAQPLVSESYTHPFETISSNTLGTLCLLECLRNYTLPCKLVVVTSDKCYKIKKDKTEYIETDEMCGSDPYSMSKAMQEQLVELYYHNYFSKPSSNIKCCTLRSGNVIGGGDFSQSRLIPDMISAIKAKEKIVLRSPLAVRPWIYVLDTISAYITASIALFEKENVSGQSFNVGLDKNNLLTVSDLVNLFLTNYDINANESVIHQTTKDYHESDYLFLSAQKIIADLHWKNKFDVKQAISETANWYRVYANKEDILQFSIAQIESHFSK